MTDLTTTHATQIRTRTIALLDATLALCDDIYQGRRDVPERVIVAQTRAHLEDLFLVVVAGEFNAGKSSLINAIVGSEVMTEGATPTTDAVTMLRYAPEAMAISQQPGWVVRALPVALLQRMSIVDTPGTNAVCAITKSSRVKSCPALMWCCLSPQPTDPLAKPSGLFWRCSTNGNAKSSW